MSLFSSNSLCQPPATWCFAAMELRVSSVTTLYSPSPFLTFLPVGVVTVLPAPLAEEPVEPPVDLPVVDGAVRWVERVAACSSVERVEVPVCDEEEPEVGAEPLYGVLDRPVPQTGQAPLPCAARTFSATAICCALPALSAVGA